MLLQNCKKLHIPSYSFQYNNEDNCCCLKHLLNMFLYSENNLQSNKYSQYFFKVVYNSYSKNNFDFKNYTLEQTKQLLSTSNIRGNTSINARPKIHLLLSPFFLKTILR